MVLLYEKRAFIESVRPMSKSRFGSRLWYVAITAYQRLAWTARFDLEVVVVLPEQADVGISWKLFRMDTSVVS